MHRRTTASFRMSVSAAAVSLAALTASACSDAPSTAPASAPAPVVTPLPASDVEPFVVLFAGGNDPADAARVTERLIQLAPSLRIAAPGGVGVTARVADLDPLVEQLPTLGGALLRVSGDEARAIAQDPGVAVIEPVRVATALGTTRTATLSWALDRTDLPALPLDGYVTRMGTNGGGARIAIFDTGIRWTHQELAGRVVAGYDAFAARAKTSWDSVGHGSAVAGVSGGATLGLSNAAQFIDIRVLNSKGSGTSVELVRGVDFLLAEKKKAPSIPIVANFSLGFAGGSTLIDSTVARLVAAGITVVAAAGNDGGDACNVSPARLPAAITVGASDQKDARATFSNIGSCVDIFAGGVSVRSPWNTADNALVLVSGTSLSAPVVTGAVATALGANPTATPAQVAAWLVRDAATGRVTGLTAATPNRMLQLKSVTLPAASTTPTPTPTPTPPPTPAPAPAVNAAFTVSCTGLSCILASTATGAAALTATYAWNLGSLIYTGVGVQRLGVRYGAAGTYSVTLKVTDTAGRTASTTQTFSVRP